MYYVSSQSFGTHVFFVAKKHECEQTYLNLYIIINGVYWVRRQDFLKQREQRTQKYSSMSQPIWWRVSFKENENAQEKEAPT